MRFSSAFHLSRPPRPVNAAPQEPARTEETAPPKRSAAAAPVQELPEELDQRVRMIGEWQLGEG